MLKCTGISDDRASRRVEMLAALGQLWSFVDFFHPDTENRIKWQEPLFEAIPKVTESMSNDEFAAVISMMLNHLNDPATRLWRNGRKASNVEGLNAGLPNVERVSDVSVVRINDWKPFVADKQSAVSALNQIAKTVTSAPRVVIDLRLLEKTSQDSLVSSAIEESHLVGALIDKVVTRPPGNLRYYYGLKPSTGGTSGGYTKFRKPFPRALFHPDKNSVPKRVVFILNEHSEVPSFVVAMQHAGKAHVIADQELNARVGNHAIEIRIPGVGVVSLRLSEFGDEKTPRGGFKINETMPNSSESGTAMDLALKRAREDSHFESLYAPISVKSSKRTTSRKSFPDVKERLLAAFKVWTVFSFFFPYTKLMDKDLNQLLIEFIPALEQCSNAREYALAIARMVSHTHDTHVSVVSDELDNFLGKASPPFACRMIEEKPVVTMMLADPDESELRVGDVILSVDGVDIVERMNELKQFISASTPQAAQLELLFLAFRGADESSISIYISRGDVEKTIVLRREARNYVRGYDLDRRREVIDLLPGSLGYADLARLERAQVGGMFEKFRHTKGIIFDMRGYPNGTGWEIAPRLLSPAHVGAITKIRQYRMTNVPAALFKCPMNPDVSGTSFPMWNEVIQHVPWMDDWKYLGKTVMLIDERTISQAEHTGLFLRAANGTRFIGSPTNGANGDVTNFVLPGGIKIYLTGQSVEHPDGTQLQRVGLIPDIEVRSTIDGIRNGIDEVLDRAVRYLSEL